MILPKSPIERTLGQLIDYLGIPVADLEIRKLTITGVSSDSRNVKPGDLFIALPGESSHGSAFLQSAMERGARAVLTDQEGDTAASRISKSFPKLVVPKPRSICGPTASWFYGNPSDSMFVSGITGTNGKTTTTYLLEQIWRFAQVKSGLIGTIGINFDGNSYPATHTTPEGDITQGILAAMREVGTRAVAMEVSSHALVQDRVKGTRFSAVGFTNLTQDHLDFHGNMASYFEAKRSLFTSEYSGVAVISIDGEFGRRIFAETELTKISISTEIGSENKADWHFEKLKGTETGYEVSIRGRSGILVENEFNLIGDYNLENLLIAIAIASESGVDQRIISESLSHLKGAPGRLERIETSDYLALVDYAHTPDAVERALSAVRKRASGKVIAVLGCGGDRDSSKRPLMGQSLHDGADIPIFTSDNPRSEDPQKILDEMVGQLTLKPSAEVILDRKAAIERAVELAQLGDLIIVLGKGHESGQEINGVKIPFSDQSELKRAIEARR